MIVIDNVEMIARAFELGEKSIVDFRKLFTPSDDDCECAWFHYEWDKVLREGTGHYAVEAFRESAKALALDVPIKTTEGWKTIAGINEGDFVYGNDGKPAEVLKVSPIFEDHDCYKFIFDDKTEVVCDAGHRWTVLDKHSRKVKTLTADYMFAHQTLGKPRNGYQEFAYRIALTSPIEYPVSELPVDPYLFGLWLGDGDKDEPHITIGASNFDEQMIYVKEKYPFDDIAVYKSHNCQKIRLNNGMRAKMASLSVFYNKHIPDIYINSSIEQRLELVRGLIDSDGSVATKGSKRGTVEFCNTNKRIVDGLVEVLGSLGIKFTVIQKKAMLYGREISDCWKVCFKTLYKVSKLSYKDNTLFPVDKRSLMRTITKIEKVATVHTKCLYVNNESHLFLITDRFIPTHNTQYVIRGFCLYRLVYPVDKQSYIVILKANQTEASKKLKEISTEYQTNPWLKTNLVRVNEDNGRAFDVIVKDRSGKEINIRIEAYGKGASIRGISYFNKRPHIIIADDLQDLSDSQSETIQVDDWEWFTSDVLFLGKKTRIFMIGNNLGASCLIERVAESAKQLGFTFVRIPILDDNEKSNWESYWKTEDILAERDNQREIGNISQWMREKMCCAIAPEKQIFKKEYFKYYDPSVLKTGELSVYTCVDVAISQSDKADYTAVCTIGVNANNHWFILDINFARMNPTEQVNAIFEAVSRYRPIKVGIEKVAYQASLEHYLYKEMPNKNLFFTIEGLKSGNKKEARIEALQPRFYTGTVWFPFGAKFLNELELELLSFPKGLHDRPSNKLSCLNSVNCWKLFRVA